MTRQLQSTSFPVFLKTSWESYSFINRSCSSGLIITARPRSCWKVMFSVVPPCQSFCQSVCSLGNPYVTTTHHAIGHMGPSPDNFTLVYLRTPSHGHCPLPTWDTFPVVLHRHVFKLFT